MSAGVTFCCDPRPCRRILVGVCQRGRSIYAAVSRHRYQLLAVNDTSGYVGLRCCRISASTSMICSNVAAVYQQ